MGLLWKYFRINLKANAEYRGAFFLQVFGMVLNNAAFIIFWLALLNRIGGDLNGYGFQDVMFLWSLSSAAFGVSVVVLGQSVTLSQVIMKGELDVYLLQPAPLIINILGSKMVVSGIGDIFYGFVLFALTRGQGIGTPQEWVMFLLFVFLGAILVAASQVIFHSLTFFLGNAVHIANLSLEALISFSIYPGSVFVGPVRWIMFFAIPVGWFAWVPRELSLRYMAGDFPLIQLFELIGADVLFVLAALGIFYLGLRRYESGNRMGARM